MRGVTGTPQGQGSHLAGPLARLERPKLSGSSCQHEAVVWTMTRLWTHRHPSFRTGCLVALLWEPDWSHARRLLHKQKEIDNWWAGDIYPLIPFWPGVGGK